MSFQERDGLLNLREVSQEGPLTEAGKPSPHLVLLSLMLLVVWTKIKAACVDYMEFVESMHYPIDAYVGQDATVGWDGADSFDEDECKLKSHTAYARTREYVVFSSIHVPKLTGLCQAQTRGD